MVTVDLKEELFLRRGELKSLMEERRSISVNDLLDDEITRDTLDHEENIMQCKMEISLIEKEIAEDIFG